MCSSQRLGGRYLNVRLNTDAFPIRVRNGTEGTTHWNHDDEVIVDAPWTDRVCASTRDLAHDRGAFQVLYAVREVFGSRERPIARQHVHIFADEAFAWNVREGPELTGFVRRAHVDVIHTDRQFE